jgi:hypothetical protein
MSENKKGRIDYIVKKVDTYGINYVLDGRLDYLLSLDFESILERFNQGDYNVLFEENVMKFMDDVLSSERLLSLIVNAKSLMEWKDVFYQDITAQKDAMIYDPEKVYSYDRSIFSRKYTYQGIDDTFALVEKFLNDERLYPLLRCLLRYESLKEEMKARRTLLRTMKEHPEKVAKIDDILNNYDSNIGIVKIVVNEDGYERIAVRVGTKHDMRISDLLDKPFPANVDIDGDPYGYNPSIKITKEFFDGGTTPNHKLMIEEEKRRRVKLRNQPTTRINGFILSNGYAIIISNTELLEHGIDPDMIGWQPLELVKRPKNLFREYKANDTTRYLSFRSKVQLTKDIVLSKRQR